MIGQVLSTIGIAAVASLLLFGCDEATEETSKTEPTKQEAPKSASSGSSTADMGGSMKTESEMTEEEREKVEAVSEAYKKTDCHLFPKNCIEAEVNHYAIKDEKAEKAGGATITRTNDARQPGMGLWSKLKKKK